MDRARVRVRVRVSSRAEIASRSATTTQLSFRGTGCRSYLVRVRGTVGRGGKGEIELFSVERLQCNCFVHGVGRGGGAGVGLQVVPGRG